MITSRFQQTWLSPNLPGVPFPYLKIGIITGLFWGLIKLCMDILLKIKNFIKVNYYLTVNSNGPLEREICDGFSRFLKPSKAVFSSEIIKDFPHGVVTRICNTWNTLKVVPMFNICSLISYFSSQICLPTSFSDIVFFIFHSSCVGLFSQIEYRIPPFLFSGS